MNRYKSGKQRIAVLFPLEKLDVSSNLQVLQFTFLEFTNIVPKLQFPFYAWAVLILTVLFLTVLIFAVFNFAIFVFAGFICKY